MKPYYWKDKPLQVVKNLNTETMQECYVIATLLEDGSSAKLGNNSGMLEFETEDLAKEYIEELRERV